MRVSFFFSFRCLKKKKKKTELGRFVTGKKQPVESGMAKERE